MKTIILKTIFALLILVFFLLSCNNSPKRKAIDVKKIIADLIDGKENFEQSKVDSIHNFIIFEETVFLKLEENQQVIINLKSKNTSKGINKFNLDDVEINKLEKRNADLKLKIENYDLSPEQELTMFKIEFYDELNDLEKSISSTVNRNIKK